MSLNIKLLAFVCLVGVVSFPICATVEHGSPGFNLEPADGLPIPLNGRIVIHNFNGVALVPDDVATRAFTLVGAEQRHPMQVVDSFDDMEGHETPWEAGAGYGESLIFIEPADGPLLPGVEYHLEADIGRGVTTLGSWTTALELDETPPVWTGSPRAILNLEDHDYYGGDEGAFGIEVMLDESGGLFYLVIEATPVGGAPPELVSAKRMIISMVEDACSYVYVWDEASSRSGILNANTGRLFDLRLTVMDSAGNAALAPGEPLRWTWQSLPMQVSERTTSSWTEQPPDTEAPLWSGPPRMTVIDLPDAPYEAVPVLRFDLPVADSSPIAFDLVSAPIEDGRSIRMSSADWLSIEDSEERCTELQLTTDSLQSIIGQVGTAYTFELLARDLYHNLSEAPGGPLQIVWTDRPIEVCLSDEAGTELPLDTTAPTWVESPTLSLAVEGESRDAELSWQIDAQLEDELPVYVLLEATPVGGGASRHLAALVRPNQPDEPSCIGMTWIDDDRFSAELDSREPPYHYGTGVGDLYELRLSAVDLHGNRSDAPTASLQAVWPHSSFEVCWTGSQAHVEAADLGARFSFAGPPTISEDDHIELPIVTRDRPFYVLIRAEPQSEGAGPVVPLFLWLEPGRVPCAPAIAGVPIPPAIYHPTVPYRFQFEVVDLRGSRLSIPAPVLLDWDVSSVLTVCLGEQHE